MAEPSVLSKSFAGAANQRGSRSRETHHVFVLLFGCHLRMAHLNLAMIHPFRDGNGRMSRALQTLVLTRNDVVSPIFCSWLGRNTDAYYAILGEIGKGAVTGSAGNTAFGEESGDRGTSERGHFCQKVPFLNDDRRLPFRQ